MSFKPFIVGTGVNAWSTLQSTIDRQKNAFKKREDIKNQINNFTSDMKKIQTTDALMNNYASLNVALGAFDLSDDLNNRYFIKRILDEGSINQSSLANRLQDNRYRQLAKNFSAEQFFFRNTSEDSFIRNISERYINISFEKAVGELNSDLRLALSFERNLSFVASARTNDAAWFQVMANPPIKEVFRKIFGLPLQFGLLDIDRQHDVMQEKSKIHLGTSDLSILTKKDNIENAVRLFLLKNQMNDVNIKSPVQIALSLIS